MHAIDSKPRLCGISVPWAISPSTAFLRLSWAEGTVDAALVEFVAYYKCLHRGVFPSRDQVQVVNAPGPFELRHDDLSVPYRVVRVAFECVSFLRVLPAISDTQVIDESSFDWSGIAGAYQDGENAEDYVRRSTRQWIETGICPDSGMYVLESSTWLRELGRDATGEKHFLLVGSEASVEVIAKKWQWAEGQPLPEWT
jgi:hypothetical protein